MTNSAPSTTTSVPTVQAGSFLTLHYRLAGPAGDVINTFLEKPGTLSLGTGEAVTSLLEEKGVPGVAQRTLIRPPLSQLGPITDAERAAIVAATSAVVGEFALASM